MLLDIESVQAGVSNDLIANYLAVAFRQEDTAGSRVRGEKESDPMTNLHDLWIVDPHVVPQSMFRDWALIKPLHEACEHWKGGVFQSRTIMNFSSNRATRAWAFVASRIFSFHDPESSKALANRRRTCLGVTGDIGLIMFVRLRIQGSKITAFPKPHVN